MRTTDEFMSLASKADELESYIERNINLFSNDFKDGAFIPYFNHSSKCICVEKYDVVLKPKFFYKKPIIAKRASQKAIANMKKYISFLEQYKNSYTIEYALFQNNELKHKFIYNGSVKMYKTESEAIKEYGDFLRIDK